MDQRSGSGGGGCCIARYTHAYDLSKMDRIMLRYRPIAPKPVSGAAPSASPTTDDVKSGGGKGKRRNSGGSSGGGSSKKRRKSRSPDGSKSEGEQKRVTLPLLPETPDLVSHSPRGNNHNRPMHQPMWLSFGGDYNNNNNNINNNKEEVVGSSVVVEVVTDTWVDGTGLGRTDEERRRRLDEDTCPGFISDGWNRVWWRNEAFRRMVGGGAVGLGMREKVELPGGKLYPAFTCRVKVQYGRQMMTVPCDVWRMDGGGFAWRLDVKAALSLGLLP